MNGNTRAFISRPKTGALAALAAFVPLSVALLSGCVTHTQVVAAPARPVVVAAPPPAPVVVGAPAYVPEPHDAYVSVALDRDVVYVGGMTYIWFVGPDGQRHRHYYGRGDLRGEVFHRRAELRNVMAHHDGHLPMQQHAFVEPPPRAPHGPRVHVEMVSRPGGHGAPRPMPRAETHPQPHPHARSETRQAQHHAPAPSRNAADHGRRLPNAHPGDAHPMAGSPRHTV
ncbi:MULTISPECIES: hypothetical protein [unclassified Paraburkholderia]|uniref:hypothetical protein n=1 Tax=unclassified Paraburkholderia TaxID=2615204 RepID=UPI002AB278D1|nr:MULTISPECIES: hypothetical protein [unclassified Paraburkholderia]